MFLKKIQLSPIGLDISELSLKAVQLKKSGKKISIQATSKIDLPKELMKNGEIKNTGALIEAIKKLIAKPGYGVFSGNLAVACLPDTKTFVKLITVDKTPNNVADIIGSEIDKHIPMSHKDIFYDWQVIKETGSEDSILIGAAPQNIVNQYIDILNQSKFSIQALEIESAAVCRCLLPQEAPNYKGPIDKNLGLIDIGATRTNMSIYAKNTIALSINMPISGQDITAEIAKTLSITEEQAEKAKIICGLDKSKAEGIIYKILNNMIKNLIEKISETMEFFNNHFPDYGPLDQIILCGGGANIKNIGDIISAAVSTPTVAGDALTHINIDKNNINKYFIPPAKKSAKSEKDENDNKAIRDVSISYATAVGLALRNLFINDL